MEIEITNAFNFSKGVINLCDNPITTPPKSIVKQGRQAILNYFKNLEVKGEETIQEAKLILVGEGNTGKTSLSRKLINEDATLPEKDERTRGVEIEKFKFKGKENKNFIANIWDFGGQNIYYSTHRFFMTPRSLYVLMAETRTNSDNNFDYWMPNIALFGKDSPILIANNLMDGFSGSPINISRFQKEGNPFNIKSRPFNINLKDNFGLAHFKKEICHQIQQLPHIGDTVPKTWKTTRDALLQLKDDYISYDKFKEICQKNGMEGIDNIKSFALYLHDIGGVLWYHNIPGLKNKIILNPQWATDAVFMVIDAVDQEKTKKGIFTLKNCKEIWKDAKYAEVQEELLELMKAFKLCYKKKNKPEYIIPALLDKEPQAENWDSENNVQIIYKYDFMPRGLVNQLTAELHDMIKDDKYVWWEGVVLKDADSDAEIKVEEDRTKRTIFINAKGSNTDYVLKTIMREMEHLHEFYPGISFRKEVCCPCHLCKDSNEPNLYEYKKLLSWLKTKTEITCNESDERILIQNILSNIGISIEDIPKETNYSLHGKLLSQPISLFSLNDEIEKIRESIEDGEMDTAIQGLKALKKKLDKMKRNTISSFLSQYNTKKRENMRGVLSNEEKDLAQNKLVNSFFYFLDELEDD